MTLKCPLWDQESSWSLQHTVKGLKKIVALSSLATQMFQDSFPIEEQVASLCPSCEMCEGSKSPKNPLGAGKYAVSSHDTNTDMTSPGSSAPSYLCIPIFSKKVLYFGQMFVQ